MIYTEGFQRHLRRQGYSGSAALDVVVYSSMSQGSAWSGCNFMRINRGPTFLTEVAGAKPAGQAYHIGTAAAISFHSVSG